MLSIVVNGLAQSRILPAPKYPPAALERQTCLKRTGTMRVSWSCNMKLIFSLILLQTGSSPWESAVQQLQTAFTGTIARGLSLVAIVVGGLMIAFGAGGNKRVFAGIVFGIGMAIAAVNFLSWLFPGS